MTFGLDGIAAASGLSAAASATAEELAEIYGRHLAANCEKTRYYDQGVTAGECNLGIALPDELANFEMACCWPELTVTALADRSRFDGFVSSSGDSVPELDAIVRENKLVSQYTMAVVDELKHGGVLLTLAPSRTAGCSIRVHTFETSAARWNGALQRIDAAIAIIDSRRFGEDTEYLPSLVNLYTEDATWVLMREDDGESWRARRSENGLGMCMATVLRNQPSNAKPLGTSRISRAVRTLTRGYIRTMTLATIGLEFATSPQKYLMGITDEQYDQLINEKFMRYCDSILLGTTDPETGIRPEYGQLVQGTLQPHVDMLRMLSTQFAAATSLSVTDTGVVNDANPTSADAVAASNEKLIRRAEDLNKLNGYDLRDVALMALAVKRNVSLGDLGDADRDIMAHFLPPSMPSLAAMADAATKIASATPEFAGTDVYWEMQAFDKPTIARIQAQTRRMTARSFLKQGQERVVTGEGIAAGARRVP